MRTDMGLLILFIAFVAVVLIAWSIGSLVISESDRRRRINRRMTMLDAGIKPDDVYQRLVRRRVSSRDQRGLAGVYDRFSDAVQQTGLALSPVRLFGVWLGCGAALWVIALVLVHNSTGPALLINGAVSLVGALGLSMLAIWVWLGGQRRGRLKKIEEQLPLALDVVNRAIRAGHPVVSAIQLAAQEMGDPIGTEFGLICDESSYGMDFKDALVNFALRTGSSDGHFFAVSVGIQSETGGNLGEILEGLATVIRSRVSLDLKVKALASEGRMSAYILSALPAFLVGFFALLEPRFYTDKFTEPMFWPIVAVVTCLYFAGWLMIQRIINFKY